MIRIAIDIEMENEGPNSGDIIQVGYCIFDAAKSEILKASGFYISVDFKLSDSIKKLTGINDFEIEARGIDLVSAYNAIINDFNKFCRKKYLEEVGSGKYTEKELSNLTPGHFGFRQPVEWGFNDSKYFGDQVKEKGSFLMFLNKSNDYDPSESLTGFVEIKTERRTPSGVIIDVHRKIPEWPFKKSMDIKTVYQATRISNELDFRGGLKESCKRLGIGFVPFKDEVAPKKFRQRGSHDARADALNTARVYLFLFSKVPSLG